MMFRACLSLFLLAGFMIAPGFAWQKTGKSAGSETSVTGCLAQGDRTNEYAITDQAGKTYGLRSSSVNLKEHLGHKVTVTGTTSNEKPDNSEAKTGKPEE